MSSDDEYDRRGVRRHSWASPEDQVRSQQMMMSPATSLVSPSRQQQQQRQRQSPRRSNDSHDSRGGSGGSGEGGDVWDALKGIFSDMDSQGGAGSEQDALAETLESLRGLLDMHRQLLKKTKGLNAKGAEMARERDAALQRLAELESMVGSCTS